MKKLYVQILIVTFIAANSFSLNGMWISRLRQRMFAPQSYRPVSTISTASSTPEADKLKNIQRDLPQTWYQKLFGIKKENPEWTYQVQRMKDERYLQNYSRAQASKREQARKIEERAELEEKLDLIKIVENAIPLEKMIAAQKHEWLYNPKIRDYKDYKQDAMWLQETTEAPIRKARLARIHLGLDESPWYGSSSDYGHEKIEEDTKNILKLKADTIQAIKNLNEVK